VAAAEQNAKCAALSAAVLDSVPAKAQKTPTAGTTPAPGAAVTIAPTSEDTASFNEERIIPGKGVIDFRRAKSLLKEAEGELPVECEWLAGSNLLLRTAALKDNKAFDERYFLYFEDTELCHRLRLAGWTCLYVPKARISHVGSASTGDSLQHWRAYYYTRNRLLFFSTYAAFPMNLLCLLAIHAHLFRHRLSLPRKGEQGTRQLKAELLGLRDFQEKRFGKCAELGNL
jgi:GT2 family glycosyltransferase